MLLSNNNNNNNNKKLLERVSPLDLQGFKERHLFLSVRKRLCNNLIRHYLVHIRFNVYYSVPSMFRAKLPRVKFLLCVHRGHCPLNSESGPPRGPPNRESASIIQWFFFFFFLQWFCIEGKDGNKVLYVPPNKKAPIKTGLEPPLHQNVVSGCLSSGSLCSRPRNSPTHNLHKSCLLYKSNKNTWNWLTGEFYWFISLRDTWEQWYHFYVQFFKMKLIQGEDTVSLA